MCGEKLYDLTALVTDKGSPPHVRGKVHRAHFFERPDGITPACAGKSCNRRWNPPYCKDHPRMCGEKSLRFLRPEALPGSPPHVRGKVASFYSY